MSISLLSEKTEEGQKIENVASIRSIPSIPSIQFKYKSILKIPMPDQESCIIAKRVLDVDDELQPMKLQRSISCEEDKFLIVTFYATELRALRVSMSGFHDMFLVVIRTLQEFTSN